MTVIQKTIGRLPVNLGDYDSTRAYGKKNRVLLYGCEWESKVNNNTYAPAALNTTTGVITPDTTHWKLINGSYNTWLIDNGYKKADANNVKDGDLTQHEINEAVSEEIGDDSTPASIKGRIKTLETNVGEGGSVDERIAAEGAQHYLKSETYTKSEVNGMITTPNQEFVTVTATDQTTTVTDVLPATGEADTIYRVGNWDGNQYDATAYSEYAWNESTSQYIHLSTKPQIGEVFDISAYHATGGTLATYSDLNDALNGVNGGVPQSLQRGGMSVKYVCSSDNKYVQYRLMSNSFSTTESDWQGIDDEPTAGSKNLPTSDGVAKMRGIVGITEADISYFTKVIHSGGGGSNNRLTYYIMPPFYGAGELYIYGANKTVYLSAGQRYDSDYIGDEVDSGGWKTITDSNPYVLKFTNSNFVSIKGCFSSTITPEDEAAFVSSLKFRIVWYRINGVKEGGIDDNSVTLPKIKTIESVYFTYGTKPTFEITKDTGTNGNIKVIFPANQTMRLMSAKQGTALFTKDFGANEAENTFVIPGNNSLLYDVVTGEFSVTRYSGTGANKVTMLSVEGGTVAYGLLKPYVPCYLYKDDSISNRHIENNTIESNKIKTVDVLKLIDGVKLSDKTIQSQSFTKTDLIYGAIQSAGGDVVATQERLTIPYVDVLKGLVISLPTSTVRNSVTYEVRVRVVGFDRNGTSIGEIGNTNNWVVKENITIPDNCVQIRISFGLYNNGYISGEGLLGNYVDGDFYVNLDGVYHSIIDVKGLKEDFDSYKANNIINQNKQRKTDAYSMIRKYGTVTVNSNIKNFSCLLFSDIHADTVAMGRLVELTNNWGNLYFDCIINGGDTVETNILESVDWYNSLVETANIPILTTLGNHDAWESQLTQVKVDASIPYGKLFPTMVGQADITQPSGAAENSLMYYYKDFTNKGIRVIVLDCMYWDSAQKTWFGNVLNDAKTNNLAVVCVVHPPMPVSSSTPIDVTFTTYLELYSDAVSNNNLEMASVVKDYIDGGGEFICWLTGHTHQDEFTHLTDITTYGNQPVVTIASARGTVLYPQVFAPDSARNQDDYTRDCLDMFSVDTQLGVFKIMRIGVNKDLQMRPKNFLTYDYKNHLVISNS